MWFERNLFGIFKKKKKKEENDNVEVERGKIVSWDFFLFFFVWNGLSKHSGMDSCTRWKLFVVDFCVKGKLSGRGKLCRENFHEKRETLLTIIFQLFTIHFYVLYFSANNLISKNQCYKYNFIYKNYRSLYSTFLFQRLY